MPLSFERQSDAAFPIEVDGISPKGLAGKSEREIASTKTWIGRKQVELGELFQIQGSLSNDQTIIWTGNLQSVHGIGQGMTGGTMIVETPAGANIGYQMSGGSVMCKSDVSDFAGVEMTGGSLQIDGSAGNLLGGRLPGSRRGMNRGSILVRGNAGKGVGQSMRRGVIAVAGDVDELCGWDMLAGSILVFGNVGPNCGAGMKRGTIVLAASPDYQLLPTFARGGTYHGYSISLMARWLQDVGFACSKDQLDRPFQMYHGDTLQGGHGEIFL